MATWLTMSRWATRRPRTDYDLLATSPDTTPTSLPQESTADDRNEMYGRHENQYQLMLIIVTHTDTRDAPGDGET